MKKLKLIVFGIFISCFSIAQIKTSEVEVSQDMAEKVEIGPKLIMDANGLPIIYSGKGSQEHNGYVQLLNSPEHQSAAGLKAGGILVSDDYGYYNPAKNDLVIKGKATVGTELQIGPPGEFWFWKSYSRVFAGGLSTGSYQQIVPSGLIKHGFGFKLLIRYSNNANWNHNMVHEVIGFCRNSGFSGSEVVLTHSTSAGLGVTGEVLGAGYTIESNANYCTIKSNPSLRNTSGTLLYVVRVETL